MSRRLVAAAAAAFALVIAGVAFESSRGGSSSARPLASAPDVPLARVAVGRFVTRVPASGRVGTSAGGEAKLAFAGPGIVAHVGVRVGEPVVAGEALAELDTRALDIDVAQARGDATAAAAAYGGGSVPARALAGATARLTVARARVLSARRGTDVARSDRTAALAAVRQSAAKLIVDASALDRQTALYAGGVAARKDVEAARETLAVDRADADATRARATSAAGNVDAAVVQSHADVAQAESDVRAAQAQGAVTGAQAASARARYAAARLSLETATLRAPASGVVISILKHPGEAVDPSQPAIVVGSRATGDITLTVAGAAAARVRAGDPVTMRLADRATERGRVRAVVPGIDAATQTTTVVVDGIRGASPGDAVEATIDVGSRDGLLVPTSAIVEDPQSGRSLVFVRERASDGTEAFVSREISVAESDERNALVAHGLHGGERIAAQGAFDLLAPSGGGRP